MANLLESTETDFPYPNSNDLEIREGAAGSTLSPRGYREHGWAREPGAGGSGDGRCGQRLGQARCCLRGPSVLQQEVGGHIQVIIRSSQGFQSVTSGKSHLHEPGNLFLRNLERRGCLLFRPPTFLIVYISSLT